MARAVGVSIGTGGRREGLARALARCWVAAGRGGGEQGELPMSLRSWRVSADGVDGARVRAAACEERVDEEGLLDVDVDVWCWCWRRCCGRRAGSVDAGAGELEPVFVRRCCAHRRGRG